MRVIAGEARGRRLTAPPGLAVRPTSDRLREAVFSSLGERVVGAQVWDACAGTGAIGIEALSRGADRVTFSEPLAEALVSLHSNLAVTRLADRGEVLAFTWERAAAFLARAGRRFAIVYYDPPYEVIECERFLAAAATILEPEGVVLIEHRTRDRVPESAAGLVFTRALRAGSSTVALFAESAEGAV